MELLELRDLLDQGVILEKTETTANPDLQVRRVQLVTVDLRDPLANGDSKECLAKQENQVNLAKMVKLACLDKLE